VEVALAVEVNAEVARAVVVVVLAADAVAAEVLARPVVVALVEAARVEVTPVVEARVVLLARVVAEVVEARPVVVALVVAATEVEWARVEAVVVARDVEVVSAAVVVPKVGGTVGALLAGGMYKTSLVAAATLDPVTVSLVTRARTRANAWLPVRLTSDPRASRTAPETIGAAMLVPLLVPMRLLGSVEGMALPGAHL
jgi:hypothetical protein